MPLKDFDSARVDARLGWLRGASEDQLSTALDRFRLSVRLSNILKCANCRTVSDLVEVGTAPVVSRKGFGKLMGRELEEFVEALVERARSSGTAIPEFDTQPVENTSPTPALPDIGSMSLLQQIESGLNMARSRDSLVWKARSGYDGTIETLDEIGARLGIGRERVRQLEKRANEQLSKWVPALPELAKTLTGLVDERSEPLTVKSLANNHGLFSGVEKRPLLFTHLIETGKSIEFHVWELEGVPIVTRISHAGWQRLKKLSEKKLGSSITEGITETQVQEMLANHASSERAPELGRALYESLKPRLHFRTLANGTDRRLVAVGRSMTGALRSILEEAATPLSLVEISRQFLEKTGARRSKMAFRNALSVAGAHVFSKRRYGLEQHLAIPPSAISPIVEAVHAITAAAPVGRQWHCANLVETIREQRPELANGLDPYTLNIVLRRSRSLQPLGRLVWRAGGAADMKSEDRQSIADLCVDALESAGKPLRHAALARRVRASRGLGDQFMPQPNRFMARLRPGVWGLLSRDFPFQPKEQRPILDRLEAVLRKRSKALHTSEVTRAIGLETDRPLKLGRAIFGLAQTDKRFRTGRGHLIGLAKWPNLGRHNSYSAIKEVAKRIHEFATPESLYLAVDALAERRVSRDRILADLNELGHKYEMKSRRWVRTKHGERAKTAPQST